MKKVVCIGGGSGQAALLRGLKQVDDISITAVVTVADDGGSTGILRSDFHIPAMGDIRNVMCALADEEDLLTNLMDYRFDKSSKTMGGHNLGNIIMTALTQKTGSFVEAISDISRVMAIKGTILPSTLQSVTLKAEMADGSIVTGESNITAAHQQVKRVFYDGPVKPYPPVLEAIADADYIIIGIGSLYTSIMPNIIIEGIRQALCRTTARTVYYCNSMTEEGETDHYSVEDHVDAIERHCGQPFIDCAVVSCDIIPEAVLQNYRGEHSEPVGTSKNEHHYIVMPEKLLHFDRQLVRHDPVCVKKSFEKIMKVL